MENLNFRSVMIVDDDSDDRMVFKESITKVDAGIRCEQASNGQEALEKLKSASTLPDYVFVDVNMPNMTGFEFLSLVRQDERLKHLRVIIYTTSNQKSAIQTAKTLGANGFLTKPEDVHVLISYLSNLITSPASVPFIETGMLLLLASLVSTL